MVLSSDHIASVIPEVMKCIVGDHTGNKMDLRRRRKIRFMSAIHEQAYCGVYLSSL